MTFEAVCLQFETNNNVLVHRFFIFVYKVLDIRISARRRKEAMQWHR